MFGLYEFDTVKSKKKKRNRYTTQTWAEQIFSDNLLTISRVANAVKTCGYGYSFVAFV